MKRDTGIVEFSGTTYRTDLMALVHYRTETELPWGVKDAMTGKIIARFQFPVQAEMFIYLKPFLAAGLSAVPRHLKREFGYPAVRSFVT